MQGFCDFLFFSVKGKTTNCHVIGGVVRKVEMARNWQELTGSQNLHHLIFIFQHW